jgi:hypothetical protein
MGIRPRGLFARALLPLAALIGCAFAASQAQAEGTGLFSAESLAVVADVRAAAAEGERSWTDGGFGKARFGGDDDEGWKLRPVATEAQIVWEPSFTWSLKGRVTLAAQHEQDQPVDLSEAYLTWKPLPRRDTRIEAKAGLHWPEISLEHHGAAWTVDDMITPSAINSWIGEEVKVIGLEGTVRQELGGHRISGTLGLFGFNDTAGTLLAFRGWAMHDQKVTAFSKQQLPPLDQSVWLDAQAPRTLPIIEIDDRVGYYGKLEWQPPLPVSLSAFHYNNRGDPEAVTENLQWGWETRFWNLGARIDLSDNTRILAQALTGTTEMGFEENGHYWVETRFRSGYARISHTIGRTTLSLRGDWFDTRERGGWMSPQESEDGWAATAAVGWNLSKNINVLGEVLHLDSDRGTRQRIGVEPKQKQTVVQAALRLSF